MSNTRSNIFMLLTGIAAGAAAAYFLSTPKGKQILEIALEKGEELTQQLSEQTNEVIEKGKTLVENAAAQGEQLLDSVSEQAIATGNEIQDKIADQTTDFEKGIDQAKAKLKMA